MSLKAILEIVLYVENFRNIDLYYQGQYHLKVNIYSQVGDKKVFAHPYYLSEFYKPKSKDNVNNENLNDQDNQEQSLNINTQIEQESQIIEETSSFLTKKFMIKFSEEEIEINDFCHFRYEVDVKPNYLDQEFFMEVLLNFYDTKKNEQENLKQNQTKDEYKTLGKALFKIKNSLIGIHEYVPVVFQEEHFCISTFYFHSILLDYKYRIINMQLSEFSQQKIDEQYYNEIFKKNIQNVQKLSEYLINHYKNISQKFLRDQFINYLKNNYNNLLEDYNQLYQKCITKKQQKIYSQYLEAPQKLIVPEFIGQENQIEIDIQKDPYDKFEKDANEILCQSVLNEINFISLQLFQLWHKFIDLIKISPRFIGAIYQYDYSQKIKYRQNSFVIKQQINSSQAFYSEKSKGENHEMQAQKLRNKLETHQLITTNLEDLNMFSNLQTSPVIFEERYLNDNNQEENILDIDLALDESELSNYKGIHLFIFVHGFQGNSFDMKQLKNNLSLIHPESLFMCSTSNEYNQTEGNIDDMGKRLAKEVLEFINENLPLCSLGRMSFIGHSLGGLIIRSCLPLLSKFHDKMFTYISLSSPHLGYMYTSSKLVEAGIWLLKNWKKSDCLTQLSMADAKDPIDTYLYKLSAYQGLNWFKHVVFFSSFQDQYAPYESARIEISQQVISDSSKNGVAYQQMVQNIINSLQPNSLYRIDVNFNIPQTNINSMIGRTAHILFLESQPLIKMIINRFENFFA